MCTNMKIGGHKLTVLSLADAQGNVWFDAEESSLSGSYSFTLDGSPQGMLILRIETKEICYIGEFSL